MMKTDLLIKEINIQALTDFLSQKNKNKRRKKYIYPL